MAITFPIFYGAASYSTSRSPSFTLDTSPLENDILLAFVTSLDTAATTDVSTWTNVRGANTVTMPADSSHAAVMVYHRVTSAEDTADTVTWTLTNLWDATETGTIGVLVMRGVATSGELQGVNYQTDDTATTPWYIPSVTPTASDVQVIGAVTGDSGKSLTITSSGWTTQVGWSSSQTNYILSRDALGVSGVGTGSCTVTPTLGGSDEYVSIVACFKPAEEARAALFTTTRLQAVNRAGSW